MQLPGQRHSTLLHRDPGSIVSSDPHALQACDAVRSAILALTEAATTGKQCQSDDWLDDIKARRLRAWQYGR